jgi:hypothetical protein
MQHWNPDFTLSNLSPVQIRAIERNLLAQVDHVGGHMAGGFTEMNEDWHPAGLTFRTALRMHWHDLVFHLGLLLHLLLLEARRRLSRAHRSKA